MRHDRKNMSGLPQVFGARVRRDGSLNGFRSIVRRNAGRDAFSRFDRNSEVGRVVLIRFAHHQRQAKLIASFPRERKANKSATIRRHVVNVFRTNFLRRHDEVTLVLAIFVINHDDHLACLDIGNNVFDVAKSVADRARMHCRVVRHNHGPLRIRVRCRHRLFQAGALCIARAYRLRR